MNQGRPPGRHVLRFPVSTLDRRELLPEGAVLSDDAIRDLAESSRVARFPLIPFLQYGSIRKDLSAFMDWHVYRNIFGYMDGRARVLGFMGEIRLPSPVFDILGYFRRNDPYTYQHILIVSALSCLFACTLAEHFRDVVLESTAGPLHDLGKVSVPLEIMKKRMPLRKTERAYLEHHTAAGFALLGYYMGDMGKFSCIVARDVYDALISPRPYRKDPFDNRTAIEEITAMAEERKIGWEIVRFLVSRNRRGNLPMEKCAVSVEKRGKPPEGNLYGVILEDDAPVTPPSSR